jgi:hypothetical protein
MVKRRAAKGSNTEAEGYVFSTFRMPQSLRDRFTLSVGERGLGDEIRRRLEQSFDREANEPAFELTNEIDSAIKLIAEHIGDWRENPFAFQVLNAAIQKLLQSQRPEGELTKQFDHGKTGEIFWYDVADSAAEAAGQIGSQVAAWSTRERREKKS